MVLFLFFVYRLGNLNKPLDNRPDIQLWGNKFINKRYGEYLKDYQVEDLPEDNTFEKIEEYLKKNKNINTYGKLQEINKDVTKLTPGTIIKKDNKLFLGKVLKSNITKKDGSNDYENSEIIVNYGKINDMPKQISD